MPTDALTLWLRVRRLPSLLVVASVCLCLTAALGNRLLPLPVVVGNEGRALWSTFLPLAWAMAVADSFTDAGAGAELRPALRTRVFDVILFLGCCIVGVLVFLPAAGEAVSPTATVAHVAILTSLAASVTLMRGPGEAALVTSSLLVVTTLYGIQAPAADMVRILQPDGNVAASLSLAASLFVITVIALIWPRSQQPEARAPLI